MENEKPKCDQCGKFHDGACSHYCSRSCCEEAAYNSAAALGVSENYDVMDEVESCCGGCVR